MRTEWAERDLTNDAWRAHSRVTLEEFRADGKIRLSETSNPDGSLCRCTYSYNEAGLLTESRFQTDDGAPGVQVHLYDDSGHPIRQVHHGPDGSERVIEESTYASDGSYTHVVYPPKIEGNVGYYCPIDGIDFYLTATGAATMRTAYDSQGRALEVVLRDADGGILRRLAVTRDESGRLVKDELWLGDQPLMPDLAVFSAGTSLATNVYSYDERGRRVEVVRRLFGLAEERETFRYDDRGNLKERTASRQTSEATVDDAGKLQCGAASSIGRRRASPTGSTCEGTGVSARHRRATGKTRTSRLSRGSAARLPTTMRRTDRDFGDSYTTSKLRSSSTSASCPEPDQLLVCA